MPPPRRLHALAALLLGMLATAAGARCDQPDPAEAAPVVDAARAESELRQIVQAALAHSRSVGAAQALAEAAARDAEEARAAKALQASIGIGVGPNLSHADAATASNLARGSATLSLNQTLWDAGRSDRLLDWRVLLAEAARHATMSQQEQLALAAVSLALERQRWQEQQRVYGQYVAKMNCLAEALQTIVDADRGRASELLQTRKAVQQAETARAQAASQHRQAEIRLQRLVGDSVPPAAAVGPWLQQLPEVTTVLADAERASEIAQLAAQARAADRFAQAVVAGNRPQIGWNAAAARGRGVGGTSGASPSASLAVGLSLSVPLLNPGADSASEAAKLRALAAHEQLADALDGRRARVREVHEQARASIERAALVHQTLRDSEQVRNATLLQWQQLGRRSLFDVMSAESEHYNLRVAEVNAVLDARQLGATLRSLGPGLVLPLQR